VAVAQRLHADVQAPARRDGCRAHGAVHRLGKVVEGGCGDGDVVAVDAACADVVNGIGVDAGLAQAVDQAPVGERAGVHAGAGTAHLAGGGVVHDGAAHGEGTAGRQRAAVGQVTRGAAAETAVGAAR